MPIGRVPAPLDEAVVLEVVDVTHQMALVEVERVGQLLLGQRAEIVQRGQDPVVNELQAALA
jgi:hypothetical protein